MTADDSDLGAAQAQSPLTELLTEVGNLLARAREDNDADRPRQAAIKLRRGLRLLAATDPGVDRDPLRQLETRLRRTLSYSLGRLGSTEAALDQLDLAGQVDPEQGPSLLAARGVLLLNVGRFEEAWSAFDQAIPFLPPEDPLALVSAYANRGVSYMSAGRLTLAQADTEMAIALAGQHELLHWQGFLTHNLGYLKYLGGDICGALASMATARPLLPESALGMSSLDRARVLLAAGLVTEAAEQAGSARDLFAAGHAVHDLTASLLVSAEIALAAQEPLESVSLARKSRVISRRRNHRVNVMLAELAEFRARAQLRGEDVRKPKSEQLLAEAQQILELVERFAVAGLPDHLTSAQMIAAEAYLDAGTVAEARELERSLPAPDTASAVGLDLSLHRHYIAARIHLAGAGVDQALAQLATGLTELARFQTQFGSQDLQVAAAVRGRHLARLGLRTAVATKDPALMVEWLDRSRAASTRLPVIRPPADQELAASLGALRVATDTALTARLAGKPDLAAEAMVDRLRNQVRTRAWTLGGAVPAGSGGADEPMTLGQVRDALSGTGNHWLGLFTGDGQLHALTVTGGQADYQVLGPVAPIVDQIRRLAADLDVLAVDRVPGPIRTVAAASLAEGLTVLNAALLSTMLGASESGLAITAVGEFATVPWGLLARLRGRAVQVSASVTGAVRALTRQHRQFDGPIVGIHGPQIPRGAQEMATLQDTYPNARLLIGDQATGANLVEHLPGADLVHIAAHGIHEADNPLFSGVLLADGPLSAYDLAPISPLPGQVILSSCDVGRSTVRPGGEPLGLTAALLRFGVPTVIAGTSRISDAAAEETLKGYHRWLTVGLTPAAALGRAIADTNTPVALTCFGS